MIISGLNKIITIEKRTVDFLNGFEVEKWTKYKTVFCSANQLYGAEYYLSKEVAANKQVNFTMHYNQAIANIINTTDFRIVFNKKYYNISDIDNIKNENITLKIRAVLIE